MTCGGALYWWSYVGKPGGYWKHSKGGQSSNQKCKKIKPLTAEDEEALAESLRIAVRSQFASSSKPTSDSSNSPKEGQSENT